MKVRCIKTDDTIGLIKGKEYEVFGETVKRYNIETDDYICYLPKELFEEVEEKELEINYEKVIEELKKENWERLSKRDAAIVELKDREETLEKEIEKLQIENAHLKEKYRGIDIEKIKAENISLRKVLKNMIELL